ncbi:O-antigen ligase family protein [Pedobacter immunditicola]|uniref:O-antigen ligase family protein n=1 Tax=Pedobacter immunditicola TaxID=3133440 RepID=UPI0030A2D9AC
MWNSFIVKYTFVTLLIILNHSFFSFEFLGISFGTLSQAMYIIYTLILYRSINKTVHKYWKYILLFFVYALINTTLTRNSSSIEGFSFILNALFYISLLFVLQYSLSVRTFVKLIAIIICIQVGVAFLELFCGFTFFTSWRSDRTLVFLGMTLVQVGSTAEDPNYLALNYLPIIPILVYLSNTTKFTRVYKQLRIIVFFLCILTVLSEARAASAIVIMIYCMFKAKGFIVKNALLLFSCFFILVFSFSYLLYYNESFIFIKNFLEDDGSSRDRTMALIGAINAFLNEPIVGVGSGNVVNYTITLFDDTLKNDVALTSLNSYWGILSEFGLIGFLIICMIITAGFKELRNVHIASKVKSVSDISVYLTISFFAYLMMSFTLDGFFKPMFWILICLILTLSKMKLTANNKTI